MYKIEYDSMWIMANEYFKPIDSNTSNLDILRKSLEIPNLCDAIVNRLEQEEHQDNWPMKDADVKELIQQEYKIHGLNLPSDDSELKRWYPLMYMAASRVKGFSYGNLVIPEDITGEPDPYE